MLHENAGANHVRSPAAATSPVMPYYIDAQRRRLVNALDPSVCSHVCADVTRARDFTPGVDRSTRWFFEAGFSGFPIDFTIEAIHEEPGWSPGSSDSAPP